MPISVGLEIVMRLPDVDQIYPSELLDFLRAIESDPDDRTRWGVLADWFDEASEPDLARACRFVMKRDRVKPKLKNRTHYNALWRWEWEGLPPSVNSATVAVSGHSIGGLIAQLAGMLRKHDEEAA